MVDELLSWNATRLYQAILCFDFNENKEEKRIKINMKDYDYLIVGAGLFGATFAYRAKQAGKKCLVIDKRPHLGGNMYCEDIEGIHVHKYGPHIFHTSNKQVWDFVNSIVEFNRFTESPVAFYKGKAYNLPFNMNTFYQMWGTITPQAAREKIEEQRKEMEGKIPQNLEFILRRKILNILEKVISL